MQVCKLFSRARGIYHNISLKFVVSSRQENASDTDQQIFTEAGGQTGLF